MKYMNKNENEIIVRIMGNDEIQMKLNISL